ncbi:MAG: hypothetical protein CVU71_16220 [Deltaproteobacteria bacterium HGW-Deltaproteobacteria-6]|jgi:oligosaccharide repeat unit polymerase|nr:MAG: hypothetical protein CVU71_16220 [Deltaproteobacteria bacterium HGW-Deltaproteobacteria-6]
MEDWQIVSIAVLLLYLFFRKRVWGWLDPLFLFLAIRIATAITVSGQYLFRPDLTAPGVLHMTLCLFVFTISLWVCSPKIKPQKISESDGSAQAHYLLGIGLAVLACKLLIMLSVFNQLPLIIGETGSDSYIEFDLNNKVASSLLLGIGSFDIVLLACCTPLLKSNKEKNWGWVALIISIVLSIAAPKKGTLLIVIFSIALGEYLRIYFFNTKTRVFTRPALMSIGILIGLGWAYFIYVSTLGAVDFESMNSALNFVWYQFMHPYSMYASGEIYDFAVNYQFNPFLYFFHTLSSVIGYPAFSASIGPSLHEDYTGMLSGHGVNPTFIIEGYIVFGKIMSVFYALFLGTLLGLVRRRLLKPSKAVGKNIALTALLLPPLYIIPIDSLLAIKIMIVCFLLIACYIVVTEPMRVIMTICHPVGSEDPR